MMRMIQPNFPHPSALEKSAMTADMTAHHDTFPTILLPLLSVRILPSDTANVKPLHIFVWNGLIRPGLRNTNGDFDDYMMWRDPSPRAETGRTKGKHLSPLMKPP